MMSLYQLLDETELSGWHKVWGFFRYRAKDRGGAQMKRGLTVEIRGYACFVNESKLSVPVKGWIAIEHLLCAGFLA